MIGRKINQYEILSKLGEGGMGVVYKAHDEKLHRHVAMKFLPREMSADPGVQKRFIQEARASSALDHPNISTVYEINETEEGGLFIVMPCYEGETLSERLERGPLEVNEALRIAAEVARGLARAHDSGVIHRDIKPGNIMLVKDGPAKIMDFGLAMISGASRLTQDGTMLGTAAYMSPEQAQGGEIDNRTDVWALGAVLYEMLAGSAPFEADHHLAVMYSIMNEKPEPLSSGDTGIPFEVEQLVSKAMEKDAAKRFQTAREMADSLDELREKLDLLPKRTELGKRMIRQRRQLVLRGISGTAVLVLVILAVWYWWPGRVKGKYPIVVLPFKNLMADSLLSESVTGELTSKLSHVAAMGVITSHTANLYKKSGKSTSEIAEDLRVKAVVRGEIKVSGNRVAVEVWLVQADSELILWTDEYNRSIGELPDLYSDIVRAIIGEIGVNITPEEETRLTSSHKVADDVYYEYLRGKHFCDMVFSSIDVEIFKKGMFHLDRAISMDSTYALPRAKMAKTIAFFFRWITSEEREELLARARIEVDIALELDPDLLEVYSARAELLYHELDYAGMGREYEKVLELDRSPETMAQYSANYLIWIGEFTEAIAVARAVVKAEPVNEEYHQNLSWALFVGRQYDEALEEIRITEELFPGQHDFVKTGTYLQLGRYEEAAQYIRESGEDPGFSDAGSWRSFMISGIETDSLININVGYDLRAYQISIAYAALGYIDISIDWLEKASEAYPVELMTINGDAEFDILRPDPRFQALMKKFKIPSGELAVLEKR